MIDTVIFDIGNVLTEWHWRESFTQMFGEALVEPLADATVRSPGWYELDRGALSEDGIVDLLTQNAPQYANEIARIVHECHDFVTVFPYAADWLKGLKEAGYKVYILSNFSEFGYNRAKPRFDFLKYADGALISYEIKEVKPDRVIYEAICERYGIVPENAVFLDDREENTAAAIDFGMHAITVENKAQTDAALRELGVHW
ncbi:MAG: HAD family phosphatase [Clostridia bacterium]|nr:HAD family phosphatase [Clostridia bacterium]